MKFIGIFLLFIPLTGFSQRTSIQGVVSVQNSATETGHRKFVANAVISDPTGKAQQQLSNNSGYFKLTYRGINDGQEVTIDVHKSALEVVNFSALTAVTGSSSYVNIWMASPKYLADLRQKTYQVGKTTSEKRLKLLLSNANKSLSLLKEDTLRNAQKILDFEAIIDRLIQDGSNTSLQADRLSQVFNFINLDEETPLYRKAFSLFQQGFLDSALSILHTHELTDQTKSLISENQRNEAILQRAQKNKAALTTKIAHNKSLLQLKITLSKANIQYDTALLLFPYLIQIDSTDPSSAYDYASILQQVNKGDSAIIYYKKILSMPQNERYVQAARTNLGIIYLDHGDLIVAEQYFTNVANDDYRFSKLSPSFDIEGQISDLIAYATLCLQNQNYILGEKLLLRAKIILTSDTTLSNETRQILTGILLNNFGVLYIKMNKLQMGKAALDTAVMINTQISNNQFGDKTPLAYSFSYLGMYYTAKRDSSNVKFFYKKALEIEYELEDQYPTIYSLILEKTLCEAGKDYQRFGELKVAEDDFLSARTITEKYLKSDIDQYLNIVGPIDQALGSLYTLTGQYAKSDSLLHQSLSACESRAKDNPIDFREHLAQLHGALAWLYFYEPNFKRSKEEFDKTLRIFTELYNQDPTRWENELKKTRTLMGFLNQKELLFQSLTPLSKYLNGAI